MDSWPLGPPGMNHQPEWISQIALSKRECAESDMVWKCEKQNDILFRYTYIVRKNMAKCMELINIYHIWGRGRMDQGKEHMVLSILMMLYFLGSVLGTSYSLYYYAHYYVLLHNNFNWESLLIRNAYCDQPFIFSFDTVWNFTTSFLNLKQVNLLHYWSIMLYNVVLVSAVWRSESVIHIHISLPSSTSQPNPIPPI